MQSTRRRPRVHVCHRGSARRPCIRPHNSNDMRLLVAWVRVAAIVAPLWQPVVGGHCPYPFPHRFLCALWRAVRRPVAAAAGAHRHGLVAARIFTAVRRLPQRRHGAELRERGRPATERGRASVWQRRRRGVWMGPRRVRVPVHPQRRCHLDVQFFGAHRRSAAGVLPGARSRACVSSLSVCRRLIAAFPVVTVLQRCRGTVDIPRRDARVWHFGKRHLSFDCGCTTAGVCGGQLRRGGGAARQPGLPG